MEHSQSYRWTWLNIDMLLSGGSLSNAPQHSTYMGAVTRQGQGRRLKWRQTLMLGRGGGEVGMGWGWRWGCVRRDEDGGRREGVMAMLACGRVLAQICHTAIGLRDR